MSQTSKIRKSYDGQSLVMEVPIHNLEELIKFNVAMQKVANGEEYPDDHDYYFERLIEASTINLEFARQLGIDLTWPNTEKEKAPDGGVGL